MNKENIMKYDDIKFNHSELKGYLMEVDLIKAVKNIKQIGKENTVSK